MDAPRPPQYGPGPSRRLGRAISHTADGPREAIHVSRLPDCRRPRGPPSFDRKNGSEARCSEAGRLDGQSTTAGGVPAAKHAQDRAIWKAGRGASVALNGSASCTWGRFLLSPRRRGGDPEPRPMPRTISRITSRQFPAPSRPGIDPLRVDAVRRLLIHPQGRARIVKREGLIERSISRKGGHWGLEKLAGFILVQQPAWANPGDERHRRRHGRLSPRSLARLPLDYCAV